MLRVENSLNIDCEDPLTPAIPINEEALLQRFSSVDEDSSDLEVQRVASVARAVVQVNWQHEAQNCRTEGDFITLLERGLPLESPNVVDILLMNAISASDGDFLLSIVQMIGGVNRQNQQGYTALHAAAFLGNFAMVEVLLDNGADPSIRSNHGMSARDVALAFHFDGVLSLLGEDDPEISRQVQTQKVLGQFTAGVTSKGELSDGRSFGLEFGTAEWMYPKVGELLEAFDKDSPLAEVFHQASQDCASEETLQKIRKGDMVVIPVIYRVGEAGHYTALVFHEGMVYFCDANNAPTVIGFEIDSTNVTLEFLTKIQNCKYLEYRSALQFLKVELPTALSKNGIRNEVPIPQEMCLKLQKGNSCSMRSAKVAVAVAFALVKEDLVEAKKEYKRWSTFSRIKLVEDYLEEVEQGKQPFNEDLFKEIWSSCVNHVGNHEKSSRKEFKQKMWEIREKFSHRFEFIHYDSMTPEEIARVIRNDFRQFKIPLTVLRENELLRKELVSQCILEGDMETIQFLSEMGLADLIKAKNMSEFLEATRDDIDFAQELFKNGLIDFDILSDEAKKEAFFQIIYRDQKGDLNKMILESNVEIKDKDILRHLANSRNLRYVQYAFDHASLRSIKLFERKTC